MVQRHKLPPWISCNSIDAEEASLVVEDRASADAKSLSCLAGNEHARKREPESNRSFSHAEDSDSEKDGYDQRHWIWERPDVAGYEQQKSAEHEWKENVSNVRPSLRDLRREEHCRKSQNNRVFIDPVEDNWRYECIKNSAD
jgi:hypothetical protein